MSTPRAIVIYYSRTGHTKRVAERIASLLDADVEEIVDTRNRSGVRGYFRSMYDAIRRRTTTLQPITHDLSSYDLVIVGTPVWNASVSTPVRTFLQETRGQLARVAFFCTCGGRGSARAMRQMQDIGRADPIALLAVRAAQLTDGVALPEIERFAATTREAIPIRVPIRTGDGGARSEPRHAS